VLDLSLHRFRGDIAPVCPILHPQRPIHCRCNFHPYCALGCRRVAVAPTTPSRRRRAFDHRRPRDVHCRRQHRIVIAPSTAVAVDIAIAPSITIVTVASPWCHPSPLLLPRCCRVFHRHRHFAVHRRHCRRCRRRRHPRRPCHRHLRLRRCHAVHRRHRHIHRCRVAVAPSIAVVAVVLSLHRPLPSIAVFVVSPPHRRVAVFAVVAVIAAAVAIVASETQNPPVVTIVTTVQW
jgi:hypothetical protein